MNFDSRSLALNSETSLLVLDREIGEVIDSLFQGDLRVSEHHPGARPPSLFASHSVDALDGSSKVTMRPAWSEIQIVPSGPLTRSEGRRPMRVVWPSTFPLPRAKPRANR